jgi:hypothetical protein
MQPFNDSFRRNFRPLLAFIGGATLEPERKPGDFTAKDHAYYAGETVAKQVVIVNDRTDRDLKGRYEWRVTQGGKVVASGEGAAEVRLGEIAHWPFRFVAPPATARTDLRIELKVTEGNETVGDDALDLQVYPPPKAAPAAEPLALLDTSDGRTGKALKAAGVPFVPVTSAAELATRHSIVVGQGALPEVAATLANLETAGRLAQGVNVLVLAQPPCALLNLIHEPAYERYVWPRDAGHPVLAGIGAEELANWRGASAMCAAYPPPDPATMNSPHYPGLKWHWGNRGIASTYPLRKPTYGNFRLLADDGFDLTLSPLIEWLDGPSRIVLCQLDVAERAGTDPVATELLRRLCAYVGAAEPPAWRAATYMGSEAGRKYLAPHLMQDSARVPAEGVIVSDGDVAPAQRGVLLAHADGGGTVLLVNPSVESLKGLGLQAEEQKVWHAALPEGDWPLLAGVSPADLYWRDERSAPVLTNLPAGSRATNPAVIAEIPHGRGRLVVWTVGTTLYDDLLTAYENNRWNTHRAYYAKTSNQDKIHRALSLILTNLGVQMRHPQLAVFRGEYGQNSRVANPMFRIALPEWRFRIDPDDVGKAQGWERPEADDTAWKALRAPGFWQDQGITDDNPKWQYDDPTMKHPYNGVAWYRVRVTIPEVLRGRELYFDADCIDDYDGVYLNGALIGQTGKETPNWWSVPRHYRLPADAIRFGAENTLAVRVTDTAGSGGFGGKQPPRIQAPASPDAFSPYLAGLSDYDINAFHNW